MGYGDEDYSKQKEENEDMSERERKPGLQANLAPLWARHVLFPVSHNDL